MAVSEVETDVPSTQRPEECRCVHAYECLRLCVCVRSIEWEIF